jgi:hypothetical protein
MDGKKLATEINTGSGKLLTPAEAGYMFQFVSGSLINPLILENVFLTF